MGTERIVEAQQQVADRLTILQAVTDASAYLHEVGHRDDIGDWPGAVRAFRELQRIVGAVRV